MKAINFLSVVVFLILFFDWVAAAKQGQKSRLTNRKYSNKRRTLKPNIYSENYDSKTVALEFDENCLDEQNKTAMEMLTSLKEEFSCLGEKEDGEIPMGHHGKIYRKYLNYSHNENDDDLCLEDKEIDWNDYCILDISHDIVLELHAVCSEDITNSIYYGSTKKNDAWNLDMADGLANNRYKRPNMGTNGVDDHKVDIWILDSGIYAGHNEFFKGQIIDEVPDKVPSGKHGTNAASIAGGINYGSSKGFYIHDYQVCGNSVSGCAFSDIEKALLVIINRMKSTGRRSVINMSLGSSGANAYVSTQNYYDALFQDVINAGGILVVSAGNSNEDACNWWFSYSDKVISVGAHDSNKNKASWSNYGACIDVWAPGSYVPAANSLTDPTVVGLVSGTSFASPMVVGVVANLLYEDNKRTKDQIVSMIKSSSNRYPIGNCATGYCYGYYYRCSLLSLYQNDIIENENESNLGIEPATGCCKSVRQINRLIDYCESLSVNECSVGSNDNYCYVASDGCD
jgi:hypothetical protein